MLKRKVNTIIILAILFVTALLWRIWCVPYADDYVYNHVYEIEELVYECENSLGSPIETIDDVAVSIYRHYFTAAGRMANNLGFISALLPRWSVVVLCAGFVTIYPLLLGLLACGRSVLKRPFMLSLLSLAMWVILPWYSGMQSTVFLYNYLFSGCLVVIVLLLYRRIDGISRLNFALALVFTVLTGWMHEGFTVPLVAFMVVSFMFYSRSPRRLWVIVAAVLGFVLTLSPGTLGRLNSVTDNKVHIPVSDMVSLWPVAVMALVVALALYKNKLKRVIDDKMLLPCLCAIAANIVVVFVSKSGGRAYWPALMFAIVGITYYLRDSLHGHKLDQWGWMPIMCVYVLFMCQLIIYQKHVSEDYDKVHQRMVLSDNNLVFIDRDDMSQPWWVFDIPLNNLYSDRLNLYFETQAAGHKNISAILPARYDGQNFSQWDTIPGDNPFRGTIGHIVSNQKIDSPQVRVRVGAFQPSVTPLQWVVTKAINALVVKDSAEMPAMCDFIGTYMGDSLYLISVPDLGYLYSHRQIESIDLLR